MKPKDAPTAKTVAAAAAAAAESVTLAEIIMNH